MYISFFAFEVLYEELQKAIISKALDPNWKALNDVTLKSELFWKLRWQGTKKEFFGKIFPNCDLANNHFWKIKTNYKYNSHPNIYFAEDVLVCVFKFLDLKVPDEIKEANTNSKARLTIERQARILYQLFIEKFKGELFDTTPDERIVYNKERNEITPNVIDKKSKKIPAIKVINELQIKQMESVIKANEIENLVTRFYNHISSSKIDKAWELLSKNFQQRVWKGKYEDFAIGYRNTLSIFNVHVWDVQIDNDAAKCNVFFMDKISVRTTKAFSNLDKLCVEDLDDFKSVIDQASEHAKKLNLEGFNRIELNKFFEPAASEYIWYKCNRDFDKVAELLPMEITVELGRVYSMSCALVDENWLITSITPIKNHLYR